jgi:hypothetical protein
VAITLIPCIVESNGWLQGCQIDKNMNIKELIFTYVEPWPSGVQGRQGVVVVVVVWFLQGFG